jgi:hypothetical protein
MFTSEDFERSLEFLNRRIDERYNRGEGYAEFRYKRSEIADAGRASAAEADD